MPWIFESYSNKIINGEKMSNENQEGPESQEGEEEQPQQQQQKPERPQFVTIQTPLDRPEFDWFLDQYMKKLGIQDRKQAAISLTNMFYDMGLDPYADLKDLQDAMKQMNAMLQSLPNTPASMQVKDTISAMYAAKTGRAMLDRMPKVTGEDAMQERMDKIMEKYLPMILTFKMMGTVMSGGEQGQQQQKNNNEKAEIPEEFKAQMAAIQSQVAETQAMLRQQNEDKQKKEERQEIISTIHSGINPQIDALRSQVEALTSALSAKELESKQHPQQSDEMREMREIQTDLRAAIDKLGQKEKSDKLSLDDLDTFMGTLESLEKRLKKGESIGEFDWKSATVSTLGEIGKEAVSIFKDMQVGRNNQPQYQGPMQPTPTQSTAQRHEVIKRQVQNFIMQKIGQGATELNIKEAADKLGLTMEEVNGVYQELVAEGWIKPRPQPGAPQQPQQTPQQQTQQPSQGGTPPVQPGTENLPFYER
jgi:hypothetical protein